MNLPTQHALAVYWNATSPYWLCVPLPPSLHGSPLEGAMRAQGMTTLDGDAHCFVQQTGLGWGSAWRGLTGLIAEHRAEVERIAILPSATMPSVNEVLQNLQSRDTIEQIAEHLWLGEALQKNRLTCFLQTIVDRRKAVVAYESFARVLGEDGSVFGGDAIITAARALQMQHVIDRHLHAEAVKAFANAKRPGSLFINCIAGFIHRPAVYLNGLGEAIARHGIAAAAIVLEITRSQAMSDVAQLRAIVDFCQSQGYRFSLDDIVSVETAMPLIRQTRPDFVKLDRQLTLRASEPGVRDDLARLVDAAHREQCSVVAEGIESDAVFEALKELGIDYFQGYLFSRPEPMTSPAA